MNAVEIEEAITELAEQPFDREAFGFQFLEAFGFKSTTLKKLKSGNSNYSKMEGGILHRNHIHLATCDEGKVTETLHALKASDETNSKRNKVKFVLATDGVQLEAEELASGEVIATSYVDFPNHFGFFLALAGISTVKQIRESSFDIRATSRLNKLYLQLRKDNPEWGTAERRHDMNHFMARLIFLFFAEDTDILNGENLFTATIEQMSERDSSNTHEVMGELFRAMNTPIDKRKEENIARWADVFPYVNGGLFSGSCEAPQFTKIARSYLLHIGNLDWQQINPDIFGSMIQAVADDEERGSLGMHYTSVPNILKVLNPLFLDDLREKLEAAGDNGRKLKNLRDRMAKIRVFDPACGSGNFLVIAYKQMREIEFEVNKRRGEEFVRSDIRIQNFRGIELRDFPAEIARLALIIAEYQCDVLYRGQKEALAEFLPLDRKNWITCGNALRLDWLTVCPPTGTAVKMQGDDLFSTPLDQAEIDFENEGGETYICGNPPYAGASVRPPKGANSETKKRFKEEADRRKADLKSIFARHINNWKSLDYVAGWFLKTAEYGLHTPTSTALVSTNSICQGQPVSTLWELLFNLGYSISFAHTSFVWKNLARQNAGVIVVIVGISNLPITNKYIFSKSRDGRVVSNRVANINGYLTPSANIFVRASQNITGEHKPLIRGNDVLDNGHFLLSPDELEQLCLTDLQKQQFTKRVYGSAEFIRGKIRHCIWIEDQFIDAAKKLPSIADKISFVANYRLSNSNSVIAKNAHKTAHQFIAKRHLPGEVTLVVPKVSSENRNWLPCGLIEPNSIVTDLVFFMNQPPLWNMALISSRIHLVWVATVCGKMKSDYRYSNTLGWNTFPIPTLTKKNKDDLTQCAENILLAREAHFPATIADLYKPDAMPENLRAAHDRNDETLERIYIGRRFKNDTERLEKLFEMYTKMTNTIEK